jgi:2-polyprenyl-6-methoxyphenol hydroxylase-like FAD-dependent oxidoreductase
MKHHKAVVVGAGFAGLIAARVLSDHFNSVVVIDKDERVGSKNPRTGASQGAHLHVLLKRGQSILRSMFPDIENIFDEAYCPKIDWAADTKWESKTGIFPRYSSDMTTYSFSRPFLEGSIHSLVSQRPNVSFIKAHAERMVIENEIATSIQGEGFHLDGPFDLVVLAAGQNFPCNRFTKHQLDDPSAHLPIQITYRSVVFETASLNLDGFKQYYYQMAAPDDPIGAVICPIENGFSIATIVEHGLPRSVRTDFEGFMSLAENVPGGEFHKILQHGRAVSDVSFFYKPSMYLRRPDKIAEFPENVFCIGDIFCSLNPVFGQGMTSALIQGQLLEELLQKSHLSSRNFHKKSAARLRLPFLLSKLGSSTKQDLPHRYLKAYLLRCQQSGKTHRKFLGALHLESSYTSLLDIPAMASAMFSKKASLQRRKND